MHADPNVRDWWPTLNDMRLEHTAVVVLNTDIDNPPKLVRRLWNEGESLFFSSSQCWRRSMCLCGVATHFHWGGFLLKHI